VTVQTCRDICAAQWRAIPREIAPARRPGGPKSKYIEPINAALKSIDQVIEIDCAGKHPRAVYAAVKTAAKRMGATQRISAWIRDGKVYMAQKETP
jgi:hypothetical protein